MAATYQLHFFVCAQIIHILQSHSSRYRDVQVLMKFKMAVTDQLHNFCGRKTQSEIIQILLSHSP